MNNFPQNRQLKKLGDKDYFTLIMGQSPDSKTYNKNGDGLPFFQGKKEFGITSPTVEQYCSNPIRIAEKGDILLSVRAPVGPTNIANQKCCIGRGLAAIRANISKIYPTYLSYFFKKFQSEIEKMGKGSTFDAITKVDLENLQIPLPPLEEQKKIVAYLDELNATITKLKAEYQSQLTALDEMRNSSLDLAFLGSREREWNLNNWKWVKLGEVCQIIGGGTPKTEIVEYWKDGNIMWTTPTDLGKVGEIISLAKTEKYITELGLKNSSAKILPKGSVLFSSRASIGKIAISETEISTNQGFANFICNADILNIFLAYVLLYFTKDIIELSNSTTFKEVSKGSLKDFQIPLPDLETQAKIVTHLDQVHQHITSLKAQVSQQIQHCDELWQSRLQQTLSQGVK